MVDELFSLGLWGGVKILLGTWVFIIAVIVVDVAGYNRPQKRNRRPE